MPHYDFNPDFLSRLEESDRLKGGKILVPIDFSPCSLEAVLYAIPLVKQFNAVLVVREGEHAFVENKIAA